MKFILDTADTAAIKRFNEILTIDGVTTNPSIITKSGKDFDVVVKEIIDILDIEQKLFIQAVSTTCEGIVEEAKYICNLREKNTYVKIPVTHEGLKAIKECKKLGFPVLATAIYTAEQGFLAAKSGADCLAPYVNRMCNFGDGVQDVIDLNEMLKVHNLNTYIVAASFKNVRQVHDLIKAGIESVTVPVDVCENMMSHPATDTAVEGFTNDWKKAYGRTTLR